MAQRDQSYSVSAHEKAGLVRLDLNGQALPAARYRVCPNGDPYFLFDPDEALTLAGRLQDAAIRVREVEGSSS